MSSTKNTRRKLRYPTVILLLLCLSFVFGAGTALFTYASGKEVAYTPSMSMVSHTEYRYGEQGQIITRLVNFQGDPVSVTNCTATIKYPDKTPFITDQLMTASSISGDHYINFTTPTGPEGVYEYQATCNYGPGGIKSRSVTNSFHLSSAFNQVLGNLSNISTQISNLNTSELLNQHNLLLANLSIVINNQQAMNVTIENTNEVVNNMSALLEAVNVTTANTYNYVTGTLTTNIDNVLTNLGVINATVNRIEVATTEINTTTQNILGNLTGQVRMSVFSG